MNNEREQTSGIPTKSYQSEPGGGPANPKTIRFVGLFIFGLIAMMIFLGGRREVARWYNASAKNALADKRYDDAVEAANTALNWDPGNESLIDLRAQARMQNHDFEGCIQDCDEMLAEAAKDGEQNESDFNPLIRKAAALQRMGKHQETLDIWEEIVAYRQRDFQLRDDHDSRYAYAIALNNRAYMIAQAFASTDSDEGQPNEFDVAAGLDQVRLAMEVRQVEDDPVILDTLGYLLLLDGKADEAIVELEKAVKLTLSEHKALRSQLTAATEVKQNSSLYARFQRELDQQYSVILHHRGEAYAAIGKEELAASDLAEALRLGYNPEDGVW